MPLHYLANPEDSAPLRPIPDKRPFDVESRRWFLHAVRRMAAFAARPAAAPEVPAPDPGAVEDLVGEVAVLWSLGGEAARQPPDQPIECMETLSAHARELGLSVHVESRSAATLRDVDLPAIALMSAGGGRLLLARRGDAFDARTVGAAYAVSVADLKAEEEGLVILVRPLASVCETPEAPVAEAATTRKAVADPVRRMIAHMAQTRRGLLIKLLMAAAFSNLMLLAMPVYSGLVFDRVIPHGAFDTLWAVSIGVLIALSADLAVRYVRLKLQDALASETSAAMQEKLTRDIVEVRLTEAPRTSSAVTLRLREIENLAHAVPQLITSLFIDLPFLLIVFGLIWLNGGAVVLAPVLGLLLLVLIHHLSNASSTITPTRRILRACGRALRPIPVCRSAR
jgi:ABC-type bacteriocin/lantibiotic exporter with double-glycine peptidase domain